MIRGYNGEKIGTRKRSISVDGFRVGEEKISGDLQRFNLRKAQILEKEVGK